MQKRLNILSLSDKVVKNYKEGNDIQSDEKKATDSNELIRNYFHKNFYKVGSREEAKALKKVMKYIDANKLRENAKFSELINEIDSMTNGSLNVDLKNLPPNAVYIDKTDEAQGTRPRTIDTSDMKQGTFWRCCCFDSCFCKYLIFSIKKGATK